MMPRSNGRAKKSARFRHRLLNAAERAGFELCPAPVSGVVFGQCVRVDPVKGGPAQNRRGKVTDLIDVQAAPSFSPYQYWLSHRIDRQRTPPKLDRRLATHLFKYT